MLLLFLAWRAICAAIALGTEVSANGLAQRGEVFTLTQDERIERELAHWDRERGLAAGREYRLFVRLRKHVPEDGFIAFLSKDSSARIPAFAYVNVLLYPRRLVLSEDLPGNWQTVVTGFGDRCYLLEYAGPSSVPLHETCDRLAVEEGFVLWRYRGSK